MNDVMAVDDVKNRMMMVRGQASLLDRDVAALYGVTTKEVNQAVRNNLDKFMPGYVYELSQRELENLRSKILTANVSSKSRVPPKVFTEKGLYMLATILKGARSVKTTIRIIETYAQLRSMVADMEALQSLKDGSPEQAHALTEAGHKLASLIGGNLSTKTTIEQNLAVVKSRTR